MSLEVGKPFTAATPGNPQIYHFFAFTVPADGKYQVTLEGPVNLIVNWCETSKQTGCLCVKDMSGSSTCCTVESGSSSCTHVAETADYMPFTAGTTIYPLVSWFSAPSGPASYKLTITGPL